MGEPKGEGTPSNAAGRGNPQEIAGLIKGLYLPLVSLIKGLLGGGSPLDCHDQRGHVDN